MNTKMMFRNVMYCVLLGAGLLLAMAAGAGCDSFIKGAVLSETGFDGAVSVVDEDQKGPYGIVTVKVPYLDIHGNPAEGQARLVVHRDALQSGKPLPAFCHVHYEKDVDGAKKWAKRGWAVFSAVYTDEKGPYPIDPAVANGYNQARAIIQWARRLPFIDPARLHIDGGSQGGYMALAMAADMFPVTAATADCPVVNWAYNLQYFQANKAAAQYPGDMKSSPLPVLCAVTMLADWCFKYFPEDLSADSWYYLSPIAWLDQIANPTLVTCATGDMLVPMEQMTRDNLRPIDPARFPEGYQRDFSPLTLCEKARKTFEECIPDQQRAIHWAPLQPNSFEISREMVTDNAPKPHARPKEEDKPWSKDRQWSLLYLDEGGPAPYAGHTTFEWAFSPDSFVDYYRQSTPEPNILNASKLSHILSRYTRTLDPLPLLKNGAPAQRLNFDAPEKKDVLAGLIAFARISPAHEAHLQNLYQDSSLKPFGDHISIAALEAIR